MRRLVEDGMDRRPAACAGALHRLATYTAILLIASVVFGTLSYHPPL